MENRGADPDAPYSYDESLAEADRYAPPRSRRRASARGCRRIATASRRKSAPAPAPCSSKSAIAVGIVLILVGAGILWGKSAVTAVSGLFKSSQVVEAPKDPAAPRCAAEDPRSRRPAVVERERRAGGAACRAV